MQFQVPQFIETEDKIVGPLTLRQFLYRAGAGGIAFFFFFFIQTWLWVVATVFLGVIGAALAFLRINGRPLPVLLRAALAYYWKPRLFLWQREKGMAKTELPELESEKRPKTTLGERLASLTLRRSGLAVGDKLKGLLEKLQTSRTPIPKRESVSHRLWRATAKSGVPQDAVSPAESGDARAPITPRSLAPEAKKERLETLRTITGAPQVAKRVDYR